MLLIDKGFCIVCSWCNRIKTIEKTFINVCSLPEKDQDKIMEMGQDLKVSHTLCPDCHKKEMAELERIRPRKRN